VNGRIKNLTPEEMMNYQYNRYKMYSNFSMPTNVGEGFFAVTMRLTKDALRKSIESNIEMIKNKYCE
jgi:hypothetical protein